MVPSPEGSNSGALSSPLDVSVTGTWGQSWSLGRGLPLGTVVVLCHYVHTVHYNLLVFPSHWPPICGKMAALPQIAHFKKIYY